MSTVQEHDSTIEVFLPFEAAWVAADRHRRDPRGWVAYQAGKRFGIAPPEHWRTRSPEDGREAG